jgi:biopolymer transport protein TolQ
MFLAIMNAVAVPVPSLSSTNMTEIPDANLAMQTMAAQDVSIIGLFLQADLMVKIVMLLLLAASIWSWAIIMEKTLSFKVMRHRIRKFQRHFSSGLSLGQLFQQANKETNDPLASVFVAAMMELSGKAPNNIDINHFKCNVKERIQQAMTVRINRLLEKAETNLSFLAIVSASTPFIGLFGTVWGIMVSFQAIALSKNTTLAVVAPGIAEALLATACGLVAAIPAVIFYNKFTNEVNVIAGQLESFAQEVALLISKELDSVK